MNNKISKIKHYLFRDINLVIRLLIVSDAITLGANGLIGPIFALFIENYIEGGNATVAGIAASIYLITKSLVQIPAATIIDKIKGEKDDFYFMFIFTFLSGLLPLFFLIISKPWQLYLVQFLIGLFTAFTFPSFMAIFTRHIDKTKEGMEWGIYFTLVDLSSATFSAMGGYLSETLGFPIVISIVCFLSLLGALLLLPIKKQLRL